MLIAAPKPFKSNIPKRTMTNPKAMADKIRDLINWVEILKEEELESGEGKKIEEDTAKVLIKKLRELAQMLGTK